MQSGSGAPQTQWNRSEGLRTEKSGLPAGRWAAQSENLEEATTGEVKTGPSARAEGHGI
jgi:hypothetical protein